MKASELVLVHLGDEEPCTPDPLALAGDPLTCACGHAAVMVWS